jgi:hypothetical protein
MEAVENSTSETSRLVLAPGPKDDIPSISRSDLPSYGLTWRDTQLRQLIKTGGFPEPYGLSMSNRAEP